MRRVELNDDWEYVEDVVPVLVDGEIEKLYMNDLIYRGDTWPSPLEVRDAIEAARTKALQLKRVILPDLDGGSFFGVPIETVNPWKPTTKEARK